MKSQNKQIECLQLLIQLFPTENLLLLHHLVDLLNKISHQPQSKMTAENLAVLFTPHLIVPRKVNDIVDFLFFNFISCCKNRTLLEIVFTFRAHVCMLLSLYLLSYFVPIFHVVMLLLKCKLLMIE